MLVRLSLAPAEPESIGISLLDQSPKPLGIPLETIVSALPTLFPELKWLFGSDIDLALSA
jgi:hypothetical protein